MRYAIIPGFAALMCIAATLALPVAAQEFPAKPVRLVLTFPPGGGSDAIARPLAQRMSKSFGQQVVVDHRPGANGIVGLEHIALSPPDGYALILTNVGPIAMNPGLNDKLPYDPVRSFSPITLVGSAQYVLMVHPSMSVRTVKDFLAVARRRPGAVNYATSGVGSTPHLAGELLKTLTGVDIVAVQYRGGGPALIAVISGQVSMYFASMPSAMPHIQSGRLLGLAVTGAKRAPAAPDIPTVAEAGVKDYEVDGWYGVMGPAGMDPARVSRIGAVIHEALQAPELREQFGKQGIDVNISTPEQFGNYIRQEIGKWSKVIRAAGIKPDA